MLDQAIFIESIFSTKIEILSIKTASNGTWSIYQLESNVSQ